MSTKTEIQPKPPLPLVHKDDTDKVAVWACGVCRRITVPVGLEPAGSEEAARLCCLCRDCQSVVIDRERHRFECPACLERRSIRWQLEAARKERESFERAEKVSEADYDGPVFCEDTDTFYRDSGELREWFEDEERETPAYAWACSKRTGELRVDSILESAADDLHEDHEWQAFAELEAFIAEWNKKQTCETWEPDYGRAVLLDGGEAGE